MFTEAFVTGFGLQSRIGSHLSLELENQTEYKPNGAGFLTFENNDIIFGQRSVKQITNNFNLNYTINSKLSLNAMIRHYWIQVNYKKQFSLTENGDLIPNNHSIDVNERDVNFNTFNIDFIAKWQFAPASEVSLAYKMGASYFDRDVNSSYGKNFSNSINEDKSNTISLKLTYLIDFNSLRSKNKKIKAL